MAELALLGGEPAVTLQRPLWPQLGAPEIAALNAAVEASHSDVNFLNSMPGEGPVAAFEAHLGAYYGRGYAVATNSCAAALQMALYAAGVSAGDEVVVSPYTWGQTVSPILHQLGIPIFADIDPASYCMRPDAVEAAIGERTKAILVVHIYGHPADMDPILEVARRYGLPVIEDCAQAMGARYKDRKVGTLGDLACFSFGDGKQIVGGDGGCVLTDDQQYRDRLVEIGSHPLRQARDIEGPDVAPYIDSLTYTYRMHPLAAVLVDKQLDFLETWHAERRANHQRLSIGLSDIPGVAPVTEATDVEHCFHKYCPSFVPDEVRGVSRERYVEAVAAEGVPLTLGYVRTPIPLRPRFQDRRYFFGNGLPWSLHPDADSLYRAGEYPVAEQRCTETELEIVFAPALRGDQSELVDQYLDAFQKVAENLDKLAG
jgi:perosamine synthetase